MRNDRDSPVTADERLGFLFSVARDPMLLADATEPLREAAIVDCNHLASELLGYRRDELVSRPLSVLEPPAGAAAVSPTSEVQIRRKDGQVLTVERSIEDVESNGTQYRIVALHDVTASRLLERALLRIQQMDNLGAVSGAAVHDFRNMLVGVVANADLALRSDSLDEETRKYIRDIQVSAERATELARRILPHTAGEGRGFEHVDPGRARP
ncbi:MAG: PAS domain S-box protein [Dehalococcoidia bacterium]|nr:PAS domain S-box protein [Dehalococcoidia bacterium]